MPFVSFLVVDPLNLVDSQTNIRTREVGLSGHRLTSKGGLVLRLSISEAIYIHAVPTSQAQLNAVDTSPLSTC